MGIVICMRAIPGSGKSSYVEKLLASLSKQGKSVEVVSADKFFTNLKGEYNFDFTKIGLAHGECFRGAIEAVQGGKDVVIVDNTGLASFELSPYKLLADAYGYDFLIKNIIANEEDAFKRQMHGVPQESHKRMHESFRDEKQIMPWWEKSNIRSETGPEGEPLFIEEDKDPYKIANQTNIVAKLASKLQRKYNFY